MTRPTISEYAGALTRPMAARDPNDAHRAATPLELFFDLVSVIAIASAVANLHHAISADHLLEGVVRFLPSFFAIWWAWMNYTWFASAYDDDGPLFRILTGIMMAGALVMTVGMKPFAENLDATLIVAGYVIMRLALVPLWLRVARDDPERRGTAYRYASGIVFVQVYWIALLLLTEPGSLMWSVLFVLGLIGELAVPAVAERHAVTPWHRHHMIERYGLLNIIVLGELLLAASLALAPAFSASVSADLVWLGLATLLITVSLFWLYFDGEEHLRSGGFERSIQWGYGHMAIFAGGAAVGAGLAAEVDLLTDHSKASAVAVHLSVAVPTAVYMLGLWFVRDRFCYRDASSLALPTSAAAVLLVSPLGVGAIAIACVVAVMVRGWLIAPHRASAEAA